MIPKEVVRRTVAFEKPDRLARSFPGKYGNDFGGFSMSPSPDSRPNSKGEETDEWGAVWENIGICRLGEVKIQAIMGSHSLDEIRAYCHALVNALSTPEGGFLPKWYPDPVGAGHSEDAVDAMCDEFLKIPMPNS